MRHSTFISTGLLLVLISFFVTACGTKVPLSEPAAVEDRSGANAAQNTRSQGDGALQSRDVTSLNVTPILVDSASNTIYFDFDSYVVKPQFQGVLEAQTKRLKAGGKISLALAGHTDEQGGREYNLALGQKRAEAVKRALIILGASEAQIEAVSYGKEKPALNGASEEAGAKNRRVEMSYR